MVIAILERRSEIGLPQAPGATRAHIRIQFLAEAIVLSPACGVAGILVGAAATASTPTARTGPPSSPPTHGRPAWPPPRSSAPSPGCCPPSAQPACHPSSLSGACDPSVVRPTPSARGLVGQSCGPADVRNARRPLPYLTVRGQHQLSTLSGTGGNQPGVTGKRSTTRIQSSRALSKPRQRHDQQLLPHVKPGDGPTDDHALDL
jgi:hypothetical protein